MNKIVLDKENIINLNITEDSICNITKDYKINELNIVLKDNTKLLINHYDEIDKNNLNIKIIQNNNSEFIYNHSFKTKKEYNLNINVVLNGNTSKNIINIHGISDGGRSKVIIDGSVNESTKNNELFENIKLLNLNDGSSDIFPNMYIDTKNVIANHAASITNINKDYLFYLNSKGLDKDSSIDLIIDGFLANEAK